MQILSLPHPSLFNFLYSPKNFHISCISDSSLCCIFLSFSDYEDIIRDAEAMRVFGFILEELELVFDGSSSDSETSSLNCSLPVSLIVRKALLSLVSVESLIRMYGKILVNSFSIPDSGTDNTSDRLYSLQQIARGVYLG